MKKFLVFCLTALLLVLPVKAAPATGAQAMILIHGPSGRVLSSHNAQKRLPMASTTKIMTALLALECCDMDEEVEIKGEWTRAEGSSMYLRSGEVCTVHDLLHGLMLASGNDAALALAGYCAGDAERFVEQMNERAAELGMEDTVFQNPNGLPEEGHYSTASDMAKLMAAAMENEKFRAVVSSRYYSREGHSYKNHNKLLWQCEGITGGKTGYTRAAGRCLVSSCCRDGLELICVTLNDRSDWADHSALYDWGFANYEACHVPRGSLAARVPVVGGAADFVDAVAAGELQLCLDKGSNVKLTADLERFVYAPIKSGAPAGTLHLWVNEMEAAALPLHWAQNVPEVNG
ncbi:MAG: D-alanyl-D-alanine carboxypeptidase [Ruminococcaceae bacterium]|nr:D-alanyl-D-alanine carboxypeptidase [Oscillospiraceae bacterium]